MEEKNIFSTSIVPFFCDKNGRIFIALKKKNGKIDFIGNTIDDKKNKESAEELMYIFKKETLLNLVPQSDNAEELKKIGIQESINMALNLDEKYIDVILFYLSSYLNTTKEVFSPEDETIADWNRAYTFIVDIDYYLNEEIIRGWFHAGPDVDEIIILEVDDEKIPALADNYQEEIYNDAMSYLKGYVVESGKMVS